MERVKELDGLRALAILLVVAWHYLGVGDGSGSIPQRIFMVGRRRPLLRSVRIFDHRHPAR
jgi:peptidoglycan/LPS O-acetylase OafA/YrhL